MANKYLQGRKNQLMSVSNSKESRTWGMICHISTFIGYLIPFGNIIAPLVIWIMKKDDPFIDYHGKEALNFQISVTIYAFIAVILALVLVGFVLMFVIMIVNLILVIIAAIKANDGNVYRYPLTIRFIK
jgi:uncharacterized Tic20 family protein